MRPSILLAITLIGCGSDSAAPEWSSNDITQTGGNVSSVTSTDTPSSAGACQCPATPAEAGAPQCPNQPDKICEPGKQVACACTGGQQGAQACAADGLSWGACQCTEKQCPACPACETCPEPPKTSGECVDLGVIGLTVNSDNTVQYVAPCPNGHLMLNCFRTDCKPVTSNYTMSDGRILNSFVSGIPGALCCED